MEAICLVILGGGNIKIRSKNKGKIIDGLKEGQGNKKEELT